MGKYILGIGLVFAVGLAFLLHKPQSRERAELPLVRVGLQTSPAIALIKVAAEKKFFEEEGLLVEIQEFMAGKFALQALLGGSLDLATPAEFPVTLATLNGEKLAILSEINETIGGFPMVLRKEGDTFDAEMYFSKKRKIATSIGGGPEFFTHDFFKHYGVDISLHEIAAMKPEDMPIALANSSVDGVAIFEPFAHFAIVQTGQEKVFAVKSDKLYSETMVLASKKEWIAGHQKESEKFLRALTKAEVFIQEHPEEAIDVVSAFTKLDTETLRSIWPTLTLRLGLHHELITKMEQETEWAKETGKVKPETPVPNFRDLIFDGPLTKIKPSAVQL